MGARVAGAPVGTDSAGDRVQSWFHIPPLCAPWPFPPPPPPPRLQLGDLRACSLVLFKFSFFFFQIFFFSLRFHPAGASRFRMPSSFPAWGSGVTSFVPGGSFPPSGARGSQAEISPAGFCLPGRPSVLVWGKFLLELVSVPASCASPPPPPPPPTLPTRTVDAAGSGDVFMPV